MKIKANLKIGDLSVQGEFDSDKELHKFMGVYGRASTKCDACKSDNVYPSYKNPGGHEYFTMECGKCGASANFGQHQNESKTLYWKGEKMAVYQGGDNPGASGPPAGQGDPF